MKIRTLLGIIMCILLSASATYSQNRGAVSGTIVNQVAQPMPETTVTVLTASDSILVNFKYSQPNGQFTIQSLPMGEFLILVSSINYADFVAPFSISADNPIYEFDTIQLIRKDIVLEEVIIKARKNIVTMNGDTLEYDVGSLKIQPNDKVEDLLRWLPGIQVDADGKIVAQGQAVTKVLVDGEEFFWG